MNRWEDTVVTDKGAALQSKLANGQTLKITRVMTGAAKVPVVNLRQQTSVTNGGKQIILQPPRTKGDQFVIPVLLENSSLEESYDLWQVGFYAEDPDEGEILYCIAQASERKNIPSASESPGFSVTWDFYFKTSNTVSFEVVLNSVGLVNIEAFQGYTEEIHTVKDRIKSISRNLDKIASTTAIIPRGSTTIQLQYVARTVSAVRVKFIESVSSLTNGTPQIIATLSDTNFYPSIDGMKFVKFNSVINGVIRIYTNGDIYVTPDTTMRDSTIYIDETFII